jgi:hypothetical protein
MATRKSVQVAMSFLPPPLLDVMKKCGFSILKVEESGALRLSISNSLPIERKAGLVGELRRTLREYGLDMSRSMSDVSSSSPRDESCLVVKRNNYGQVVPLFKPSGEPYPEIADIPERDMPSRRKAA